MNRPLSPSALQALAAGGTPSRLTLLPAPSTSADQDAILRALRALSNACHGQRTCSLTWDETGRPWGTLVIHADDWDDDFRRIHVVAFGFVQQDPEACRLRAGTDYLHLHVPEGMVYVRPGRLVRGAA